MCHKMTVTKVTMPASLMRTHHFAGTQWVGGLLDPRRSLGIKVAWLVCGLSLGFAVIAAVWLGSMTREGLLQQHCRQLALDADQLANTLDQALGTRVQSLQTIAAILGTNADFTVPQAARTVLAQLRSTYPEMAWIGFADSTGTVVASTDRDDEGRQATSRRWFQQGVQSLYIAESVGQATGEPHGAGDAAGRARDIDIAVPIGNAPARPVGVVDARLDGNWLQGLAVEMRRALRQQGAPEALILDRDHRVLVGPEEAVGKAWQVEASHAIEPVDAAATAPGQGAATPTVRLERLADGRMIIAAAIEPRTRGVLSALGWTFQLIEPAARADQRADRLWSQIVWVCLAMGSVAALAGVAISRRLTRRLALLSRSVDAVGSGTESRIAVPGGVDEVSRLGLAFSGLLDALQKEKAALGELSADLERRVATRTREVERLARESRYAAVVRERLKIARDLHDTLAHSMMAMLAEVRLLKKLHDRDPAALAAELAHAEQVAHEGLIEARASITKMRFNPVRDVGLGAALADSLKRFSERTGLPVETDFDPTAASFAEETAEAVFRIAEEALRNIERHANASTVKAALRHVGAGQLALSIEDDGIGFDTDGVNTGHYGLVGMREQAQLIGARLAIRSEPMKGTLLHLEFSAGVDTA